MMPQPCPTGAPTLLRATDIEGQPADRLACLKALRDKWTNELQHLVMSDPERAQHLAEALDDLAILMGRADGRARNNLIRNSLLAMNEAIRIIDELTRAIEGDPWHGSPAASIVRDVTATTAAARPHAGVHSIWEIVRHMTAWTAEVARRLDGHPPGQPQEGDWPPPSGPGDDDWRRDVAALVEAHHRLLRLIATLSDESIQAPPAEHRDRPAGSGVTHYVLLHGLAQHHAYHAGQIALLKKLAPAG